MILQKKLLIILVCKINLIQVQKRLLQKNYLLYNRNELRKLWLQAFLQFWTTLQH